MNGPRFGLTYSPPASLQGSPLVSLCPLLTVTIPQACGPLTPRTVLPPVGNSLRLLPNLGTGPLERRSALPGHLPGPPCDIRRHGRGAM